MWEAGDVWFPGHETIVGHQEAGVGGRGARCEGKEVWSKRVSE